MKQLQRLSIIFMLIALILIILPTQTANGATDLIPLPKADGVGSVRYRGTSIDVMIPTTHSKPDVEFRGVWITHFTGDIPRYTSEAQYKAEINKVFEVMEYYQLNAMVFHVRTHNNALYQSDLSPVASWWSSVNFSEFDPLEWIIEECHKRGIEFHAWMNPYRISSSHYGSALPAINPASNSANLLTNGSTTIFNPGLPVVRQFLEDVCIEFLERYNADAIHFDDYFYVSNVNDSQTRATYNTTGLSIEDWRRQQVDIMIEQLSDTIRAFNLENDRRVQFGISPTGIYRNGNGVVTYDPDTGNGITTGSNTSGFQHYGDYLYSDTKKWIDEEWLDYIAPQSYWGFEHPVAGFADVMDWWVKIVENKNVNLYSGMGLYMAISSSDTYSWKTNPQEAYNQLLYLSRYEKNQGFCIFSYKHIQQAYSGSSTILRNLMEPVRESFWNSPALLPETNLYAPEILSAVPGFFMEIEGTSNTLSWGTNPNAKYYAIYRSTDEITFSSDELLIVVGSSGELIQEFTDTSGSIAHHYGIRAISKTNSLGEGTTISEAQPSNMKNVVFVGKGDVVLKIDSVIIGESAVAPTVYEPPGHTFIGWDQTFTDVQDHLVIYALYDVEEFSVTFIDFHQSVLSEIAVKYGDAVTAPTPPQVPGYTFVGWNRPLTNIIANQEIEAVYQKDSYQVIFKGMSGNTITTIVAEYGDEIEAPIAPAIVGYTFIGWNQTFDFITGNMSILAEYDQNSYTVLFLDLYHNVLDEQTLLHGQSAIAPETPSIPGFEFIGWTRGFNNIQSNLEIYAIYEMVELSVVFLDFDGQEITTATVYYGGSVTPPTAPSVEGYIFVGWSQSLRSIRDNIVVEAIYVEEPIYFTVVFQDVDENVLSTQTIEQGKNAIAPTPPTVQGYDFTGWDQSFDTVQDNLVIKPTYILAPIHYTVEFLDANDQVLQSDEIVAGGSAVAPTPPTKVGHTFVDWNQDFTNIQTNLTIEPIFIINEYTVTFMDGQGNIYEEQMVTHGSAAVISGSPTLEGHLFKGWSESLEDITESKTITPIFEEIEEGITERVSSCSRFNVWQIFTVLLSVAGFYFFRRKTK